MGLPFGFAYALRRDWHFTHKTGFDVLRRRSSGNGGAGCFVELLLLFLQRLLYGVRGCFSPDDWRGFSIKKHRLRDAGGDDIFSSFHRDSGGCKGVMGVLMEYVMPEKFLSCPIKRGVLQCSYHAFTKVFCWAD